MESWKEPLFLRRICRLCPVWGAEVHVTIYKEPRSATVGNRLNSNVREYLTVLFLLFSSFIWCIYHVVLFVCVVMVWYIELCYFFQHARRSLAHGSPHLPSACLEALGPWRHNRLQILQAIITPHSSTRYGHFLYFA